LPHVNRIWGSVKCGEFVEYREKYYLLKKEYFPRIYLSINRDVFWGWGTACLELNIHYWPHSFTDVKP